MTRASPRASRSTRQRCFASSPTTSIGSRALLVEVLTTAAGGAPRLRLRRTRSTGSRCRSRCHEGARHRSGRLHRVGRRRRVARGRSRGRRAGRLHPAGTWDASPDGERREGGAGRRAGCASRWARLLHGVDVVCHQAAMVGAGVSAGRPSPVRLAQRPRHRDAAGSHGASRRRAVWCSPRRWWSTATAAMRARTTASSRQRSRSLADAASRAVRRRLPALRAADDLATGRRGRPRSSPRSGYAASKVAQEHYVAAWARQTGGTAIALRYHNVYGPGMPADTPVLGCRRLVPFGAGAW